MQCRSIIEAFKFGIQTNLPIIIAGICLNRIALKAALATPLHHFKLGLQQAFDFLDRMICQGLWYFGDHLLHGIWVDFHP